MGESTAWTAARCVACGEGLPSSRSVCPRCGRSRHVLAELERDDSPLIPEPRTLPRGAVASALAVLVIGVLIALIVVLPFGPTVQRDALESSVLAQLHAKAPPSSGKQGTSLSCRHPFTNTNSFTCHGKMDISLLPDARFDMRLEIYRDAGAVCWTGRPRDDGPSGAFVPKVIGACLRS